MHELKIMQELAENSDEVKTILIYFKVILFIYDVWERILAKKIFFIGLFHKHFKKEKTTGGLGTVVFSKQSNNLFV